MIKQLKTNDTLKNELNKYLIVYYSGELTNPSLANKIIANVNSPLTFLFNTNQTLENVAPGFKSAKKYIEKINQINISESEKIFFDSELKISLIIEQKGKLDRGSISILENPHKSFHLVYLAFKNSLNLNQKDKALIYAKYILQIDDKFIKTIYQKEIEEMKKFINN